MSNDEHPKPKNPIDAAREGREQLERAPHHPTTGADKGAHEQERPVTETPGEAHRTGPLPNLKK